MDSRLARESGLTIEELGGGDAGREVERGGDPGREVIEVERGGDAGRKVEGDGDAGRKVEGDGDADRKVERDGAGESPRSREATMEVGEPRADAGRGCCGLGGGGDLGGPENEPAPDGDLVSIGTLMIAGGLRGCGADAERLWTVGC